MGLGCPPCLISPHTPRWVKCEAQSILSHAAPELGNAAAASLPSAKFHFMAVNGEKKQMFTNKCKHRGGGSQTLAICNLISVPKSELPDLRGLATLTDLGVAGLGPY